MHTEHARFMPSAAVQASGVETQRRAICFSRLLTPNACCAHAFRKVDRMYLTLPKGSELSFGDSETELGKALDTRKPCAAVELCAPEPFAEGKERDVSLV
ncbi:hypothetical protein NN561_007375 [Cricetulus griseus]